MTSKRQNIHLFPESVKLLETLSDCIYLVRSRKPHFLCGCSLLLTTVEKRPFSDLQCPLLHEACLCRKRATLQNTRFIKHWISENKKKSLSPSYIFTKHNVKTFGLLPFNTSSVLCISVPSHHRLSLCALVKKKKEKKKENLISLMNVKSKKKKQKQKNLLSNSCLANRANNEIQHSFPTVVRIIFGGDARAAAPTHC